MNFDGGMLLYFVSIGCGCISLLATAILLCKVRKDGAIKDVKSVRTVIKIQVFAALMAAAPYVFACLITPLEIIRNIFQNFQSNHWRNGFDGIGSFILILVVISSIICLVPNFLYWYQLPYI